MSDLASAAARLGVPEAIVRRSAEARAKATGASVDEVLAAWAGGASAPTVTSTAPAAAPAETEPPAADTPPPPPATEGASPAGGPVMATAPPPAPRQVAAAHTLDPPVLRGRRESLVTVAAGSVGLLLLSWLLGFLLPALPQDSNGVRSSNHSFSSEALEGRQIYLSEGCGACHTQLIRAVVLDAGLGPVTLSDTNQVIGQRRFGPDLAAVGSRMDDPEVMAGLLAGEGDHPSASLSETDLAALIAYLAESR